jgi:SAM-dependent methyltransferase
VLLPGTLEPDLARRVPALLSRARALLRLSGGPSDRLAPGELKRAALAVESLHQGLVGERRLASAGTYDQAAHLGAYLLWWWPQSYAKVRAALSLAPPPAALVEARGTVALLDLGAGPGPGALALVDHLAARGLRGDALLLDKSVAALAEAKALAQGGLRTETADLARGPQALPKAGPGTQRFALVCAAHLLSELPGGAVEKARFVRAAAALLAPGGVLVLVEPALRETGRALLEVRDLLLAPGPATRAALASPASDPAGSAAGTGPTAPLAALGPCFTQRPCPALDHPRDWCTAEQPWTPPAYLLALSRELGLHAEAPLQFAPLLLGHAAPAPADGVWRVVGLPPAEKGKKRLFVCSDAGRTAVARLDRDQGAASAAFDAAGRGDVLRLSGLVEKGDGLRLGPGGAAELL